MCYWTSLASFVLHYCISVCTVVFFLFKISLFNLCSTKENIIVFFCVWLILKNFRKIIATYSKVKWNFSLYSLYYAEACNEFAGLICVIASLGMLLFEQIIKNCKSCYSGKDVWHNFIQTGQCITWLLKLLLCSVVPKQGGMGQNCKRVE